MAKSSSGSFKDSVAQTAAITATVQMGELAPVYLLMGEESYFIDQLEKIIASAALAPEERDFNQTIFYGKDSTAADIAMACRRYPMMSQRQLVIVREAQSLAKIDDLQPYVEKPTPTTTLIICHKTKNLDKRSTLYKAFSKSSTIFESVPPRDYELDAYLREFLGKKRIKASDKAIAMLGEYLGTNLSKLDNEVSKLLTIIGEEGGTLTEEMIEKNIGISKDYNVFELTKALSVRDFKKAMFIGEQFGNNPKNFPLVLTMASLFNHFQRIVMVGLLQWEAKRRSTAPPSESDIAKRLGVSPFFVREYITASKNYPLKSAFDILGLLREYDMKSKGIGGGSNDDSDLLKELLLRITIA